MKDLIFTKIEKIAKGEMVVMSDDQLDYLDSLDHDTIFYVSAPNPQQVGTLDRWLVAKPDHPYMARMRREMYGI